MSASFSIVEDSRDTSFHRVRRESRARKTAIAGFAARIVNYGIRLLTIPLSLHLLGRARYGLWITVGSIVVWFGLSELGISTGLINTVSRAYGREDWEEARGYVSTGFFCYSFLAAMALCAVLCISTWPGLPHFIGARGNAALALEARRLFIVCGAVWAASFSLYAVGPLCLAFQEGYLQNYAQIAGAALSLAGLGLLTWHGASLAGFALVVGVPPLAANGVLGFYFLFLRHRRIRPSWRYWRASYLKGLLRIGGPMALVQVSDCWITYSIAILIANRLGSGQVPMYTVPATAFIVVMGLCSNFTSPYLPAFAEAAGRGDWPWIRRAAVRNLYIVVAAMLLAAVGLVALGPYIIPRWTGRQVVPTRTLLFCLGLFYAMLTWAATNGTLLVGLGMVKTKAFINCTVAALYVAGSWLGISRFGLIAVPIAGCVACSVDMLLSLPLALLKIRRSAADGQPPAPIRAAAGVEVA